MPSVGNQHQSFLNNVSIWPVKSVSPHFREEFAELYLSSFSSFLPLLFLSTCCDIPFVQIYFCRRLSSSNTLPSIIKCGCVLTNSLPTYLWGPNCSFPSGLMYHKAVLFFLSICFLCNVTAEMKEGKESELNLTPGLVQSMLGNPCSAALGVTCPVSWPT